ncbi:hypothetical protein CR513_16679, partial [Mucuna pruriens]
MILMVFVLHGLHKNFEDVRNQIPINPNIPIVEELIDLFTVAFNAYILLCNIGAFIPPIPLPNLFTFTLFQGYLGDGIVTITTSSSNLIPLISLFAPLKILIPALMLIIQALLTIRLPEVIQTSMDMERKALFGTIICNLSNTQDKLHTNNSIHITTSINSRWFHSTYRHMVNPNFTLNHNPNSPHCITRHMTTFPTQSPTDVSQRSSMTHVTATQQLAKKRILNKPAQAMKTPAEEKLTTVLDGQHQHPEREYLASSDAFGSLQQEAARCVLEHKYSPTR